MFVVGALMLLLAFIVAPPVRGQVGGPFPRFEWGPGFQATALFGAALDDGFSALHNPASIFACRERHVAFEQKKPFDVPVTAVAWCGRPSTSESSPTPSPTPPPTPSLTPSPAPPPTPSLTPPPTPSLTPPPTPSLTPSLTPSPAPSRTLSPTGIFTSAGGHLIVRQTPPGLGFDYNTYALAWTGGLALPAGGAVVRLGLTPKLLFVSITGTETDYDDDGFGYGLDAGVAVDMPTRSSGNGFSISFAGLDVVGRMQYGRGAAEEAAERRYIFSAVDSGPRYTVGVSARVEEDSVRWSAGAEYVLEVAALTEQGLRLVLRAGYGFGGSDLSFGFGITIRNFAVDYAFTRERGGFGDEGMHSVATRIYF